jgi:Flp pilus assembly CpaE family ATPase
VVSNGSRPTPKLDVLLSGPAAGNVAATLELQPALSIVGAGEADGGSAADVAVLALHSSSDPNVADEARKLRGVTGVPFILAAYGEPNRIVEAGLAVGAADVLVLPQPAETLIFALRKAAMAAAGTSTGKVVTVFSPKGGSGKTVLATNLAVAAARSGVKTLLVDLDLQFGDSALTLALSPRATIADLAASAGEIDAEKLKAFVTADSRTGLAVLPSPQRPEEADVVGAAELAAVLSAARSSYDAVVIDTGPLFDGAMLAALDHSDQLLLVCNPEVTSLKNVRIGLETIDRLGFERERVSLVANRIGAPGGVDRADIELALDAEVTYELPDDRAVPAAVNRALPVVVSDESGPFARALGDLLPSVFPASPESSDDTSRTTSQRRFLLRGRR